MIDYTLQQYVQSMRKYVSLRWSSFQKFCYLLKFKAQLIHTMENRKALLIIDMQKGSFTPETPRHDTDGVVNRINALSKQFREKQLPVIFIQHDGTRENCFIPDTDDWKLLSALDVQPGDLIISKEANDAFYRTRLRPILDEMDIRELVVTGCATDFCVEATIQSALAKDYHVTVVSNGHTTGERPHLSAQKVIEHYNWIWQNMIPTQGRIRVLESNSITI